MLSVVPRLLPEGRKWANPSKESSRLNMHKGPEPSLPSPHSHTACTALCYVDGTEEGFKEKERSREVFVPAFLVEESSMRTLTFPLRAPLRGPQLQDRGGWSLYELCITIREAPVLLKKAPELDPSAIEGLGGSSIPSIEQMKGGKREEGTSMHALHRAVQSWALFKINSTYSYQ